MISTLNSDHFTQIVFPDTRRAFLSDDDGNEVDDDGYVYFWVAYNITVANIWGRSHNVSIANV